MAGVNDAGTIADDGSAYTADVSNDRNCLINIFHAFGGSGRTINVYQHDTENYVQGTFNSGTAGPNTHYQSWGHITDSNIPTGSQNNTLTWNGGALTEDGRIAHMSLYDVDQTTPIKATSGTQFAITGATNNPGGLDYSGVVGEIVVYIAAKSNTNSFTAPSGFTTGDTETPSGSLAALAYYYKILTGSETSTVAASSSGTPIWLHSVFVVQSDTGGGGGGTILPFITQHYRGLN